MEAAMSKDKKDDESDFLKKVCEKKWNIEHIIRGDYFKIDDKFKVKGKIKEEGDHELVLKAKKVKHRKKNREQTSMSPKKNPLEVQYFPDNNMCLLVQVQLHDQDHSHDLFILFVDKEVEVEVVIDGERVRVTCGFIFLTLADHNDDDHDHPSFPYDSSGKLDLQNMLTFDHRDSGTGNFV